MTGALDLRPANVVPLHPRGGRALKVFKALNANLVDALHASQSREMRMRRLDEDVVTRDEDVALFWLPQGEKVREVLPKPSLCKVALNPQFLTLTWNGSDGVHEACGKRRDGRDGENTNSIASSTALCFCCIVLFDITVTRCIPNPAMT